MRRPLNLKLALLMLVISCSKEYKEIEPFYSNSPLHEANLIFINKNNDPSEFFIRTGISDTVYNGDTLIGDLYHPELQMTLEPNDSIAKKITWRGNNYLQVYFGDRSPITILENQEYKIILDEYNYFPKVYQQTLNPIINWQLQYTCPDEHYPGRIISYQGELLVVGAVGACGLFQGASGHSGYLDGYVVKLDQAGDQIWASYIGGSDYDHATTVCKTTDGSFLVGGYTNSSLDPTCSYGEYNGFISKIDQNGNISWTRCYGGNGTDKIWDISPAHDDGFIITGGSSSTDGDLATKTDPLNGIWVFKIDVSGNIQWQKFFGTSIYQYTANVCKTSDQGYAFLALTEDYYSTDDIILYKTDAQGNLGWKKKYGGSNFDMGNSLVTLDDGGFLIAGTTYSYDGDVKSRPDPNNEWTYECDVWLVKTDQTGNIEWEKSFGEDQEDKSVEILKSNNTGKFYLLAEIYSQDEGEIPMSFGSTDTWLLEISDNGEIISDLVIGGDGQDRPKSFCMTENEKPVILINSDSKDGMLSPGFVNSDYHDFAWIVNVQNINPE